MEWISVKDRLPEKKEGWNHSEQVAVYYGTGPNMVTKPGIAYYHFEPPFREPGFVDFANYGRQPLYWMPLPAPPVID